MNIFIINNKIDCKSGLEQAKQFDHIIHIHFVVSSNSFPNASLKTSTTSSTPAVLTSPLGPSTTSLAAPSSTTSPTQSSFEIDPSYSQYQNDRSTAKSTYRTNSLYLLIIKQYFDTNNRTIRSRRSYQLAITKYLRSSSKKFSWRRKAATRPNFSNFIINTFSTTRI